MRFSRATNNQLARRLINYMNYVVCVIGISFGLLLVCGVVANGHRSATLGITSEEETSSITVTTAAAYMIVTEISADRFLLYENYGG